MSDITVYARAPTREAGLAFMAATGVAEEIDGKIVPKVNVHLVTSDEFPAPASGWFVNLRYYGSSAEALANGGDPTAADLFEKYPGLLVLSEVRTGKPMEWVALPGDPTPPGYENYDGIRLYDPAFIATPSNIIA